MPGPRSSADDHHFRTNVALIRTDRTHLSALNVETGNFDARVDAGAVLRRFRSESFDCFPGRGEAAHALMQDTFDPFTVEIFEHALHVARAVRLPEIQVGGVADLLLACV